MLFAVLIQFSLHLIVQYMHVCMPRVKNLEKKHPHVAGQHAVRGSGGGGGCGGDADVHSTRIQWRPIVAAWQLVDVSQTVAALLYEHRQRPTPLYYY